MSSAAGLIQVPVWIALQLKRARRCQIKPPDWLTVESLSSHLQDEKSSQVFPNSNLPFHYIELATLLLKSARDDIPQANKIDELLRDIQVKIPTAMRGPANHPSPINLFLTSLSLLDVICLFLCRMFVRARFAMVCSNFSQEFL
jgi:GINS complex subunit 2